MRVAIVGACGMVGRMFLKVLEERRPDVDEYVLFSSKNSAGKEVKFLGKEYEYKELKEDSFDTKFDFALFSAGKDVSKKMAPIAASKGTIVIDNSSAWRMDKEVPLIVPEVNMEEAVHNNGIIANPENTVQIIIRILITVFNSDFSFFSTLLLSLATF